MAAPPADVVTALQEALGRLNGVLFNYLGALQRDAPPAALKGEALLAPPKSYDVQARAARGRQAGGAAAASVAGRQVCGRCAPAAAAAASACCHCQRPLPHAPPRLLARRRRRS